MLRKIICSNLVKKLYFVYFLNVLDWVCTVILLNTGMFFEANPIANSFIHNVFIGFLLKCVVPFVLVFIVNRFMHILEVSQLRLADMMISFALTVYLAVNLDHIINFIILLCF